MFTKYEIEAIVITLRIDNHIFLKSKIKWDFDGSIYNIVND